MSDDQNTPSTPPITKPPAGAPTSKATAPAPAPTPAPAGVSRTALIWIGVAVVVLSFVASFLGATLARSNDANEAVPAPTASETQPSTEEYEAALEEILPAGAAVRAGAGVPESGKGYEGEVYIDISTSDVYLFRDGEWVSVGNIRASAAENLTGETGAAARPAPRARRARRGLPARRSHWRRCSGRRAVPDRRRPLHLPQHRCGGVLRVHRCGVDAGLAGAHCGGCHAGADGGHQRLIARQPSPRLAASSSRQFAGTRSAGPGTDWVGGWLSGGAR